MRFSVVFMSHKPLTWATLLMPQTTGSIFTNLTLKQICVRVYASKRSELPADLADETEPSRCSTNQSCSPGVVPYNEVLASLRY